MRKSFLLFLIFFSILVGNQLYAQGAWVAPKGTGSVSISYLNDFSNQDYFDHGEHVVPTPFGLATYFGDNRSQGVFFDLTYSFTDKFGIAVSIPYIAAKYKAPPPDQQVNALVSPHRFADGSIPLDDGHYHGNFQDFSFRVRYNVTEKPFHITPYFEFGLPSNDYLFYSHAVVGENVRSVGIGVFLGGTLDPMLPNAYISGRYGYDWYEKVLNVSRGANVGELEFGYFIAPPVRAFVILAGQYMNGGLGALAGFPNAGDGQSDTLFFHHTQLVKENYLNIGVGGNYSINNRFDVFGVVTRMLDGRNVHGLTYGLNFGFSWGFGGAPQRPCHC